MSIVSWYLKPKRKMAEKHTRHVRMGKYDVTSHAQNRTVEPTRNLKKKDMVINLFSPISKNSKTYTYFDGTIQYDRVNDKNRTITRITRRGNAVKTIQKYHNNIKGKKDAYKNFK